MLFYLYSRVQCLPFPKNIYILYTIHSLRNGLLYTIFIPYFKQLTDTPWRSQYIKCTSSTYYRTTHNHLHPILVCRRHPLIRSSTRIWSGHLVPCRLKIELSNQGEYNTMWVMLIILEYNVASCSKCVSLKFTLKSNTKSTTKTRRKVHQHT